MTAVSNDFPGSFNDYVASIVAYWQEQDKQSLRGLRDDLVRLGLTWKVEAVPVDDTHVELRVGRLAKGRRGGARDLVNIADVGFGLSQILPVLVALRVAQSGQVVYLEQPEIHLHPRAQAGLARVIKEAIDRRVQVIVETHSDLLLRAIQTEIASTALAPDDVGLLWFDRDPVNGYTKITPARLEDDGTFGDWPSDFDDVTLGVEQGFLRASLLS